MPLSKKDRKRLKTTVLGNVARMPEGPEKNMSVIILALIDELETLERTVAPGSREEKNCLQQELESLLDGFSTLALPPVVDEQHLQYFTVLADNLTRLSAKVNTLRGLLVRLHAEGVPLKTDKALILH